MKLIFRHSALLFLIIFVFASCASKPKKELIQGTWKIIKVENWDEDLKKFEDEPITKDNEMFALIHNNMVILSSFNKNEVEHYNYYFKGENLIIKIGDKDSMDVKINELTDKNFEVELMFFGKTRWRFERSEL